MGTITQEEELQMALSAVSKKWCFDTAVSMGLKAAESGGMQKGIEIADTIEHVYNVLKKLAEEQE